MGSRQAAKAQIPDNAAKAVAARAPRHCAENKMGTRRPAQTQAKPKAAPMLVPQHSPSSAPEIMHRGQVNIGANAKPQAAMPKHIANSSGRPTVPSRRTANLARYASPRDPSG